VRITPNMDGPVGGFGLSAAGVRYDAVLDWNLRTADWRCTITKRLDATTLVAHARISPGTRLLVMPDASEIYVGGADPYTVDAFTRGEVWLEWLAAADMAEIRASEAPPNPGIVLV